MPNYILEIEKNLGNYRRLPEVPFYSKSVYAVFPALDDDFVNRPLYEVLYEANRNIGNKKFIVCAIINIKDRPLTVLYQEKLNWKEFEKFQNSDMVYKGFYITGNKLNWLGIYHPDDYIIIGGNAELVNSVNNRLYGNSGWQEEFEKAYLNGRIDMYKEDFYVLKRKLFSRV